MHHFFSIPELVELICEELAHPRPLRKDLATFARTATVFHHPAVDILWRHQNSPMNVILCMPADLWESEESAKNQSNYVRSSMKAFDDTLIPRSGVPLPLRISSAR
jgi:hypothetical protein